VAIARLLDRETARATTTAARASVRLRSNLNLHEHPGDPIQRMLNALQPSTYIRPHRHAAGRFELITAIRGRCGLIVFDGEGALLEAHVLTPGGVWAVELPGGAWHTLVALAPDTLLLEVKPGPYDPATDKEAAPWSPPESAPEAATLVRRWEALFAPGSASATTPLP